MQNLQWIISQLSNPFFWILPVMSLLLLAVWPVIIYRLEEKASRLNRR